MWSKIITILPIPFFCELLLLISFTPFLSWYEVSQKTFKPTRSHPTHLVWKKLGTFHPFFAYIYQNPMPCFHVFFIFHVDFQSMQIVCPLTKFVNRCCVTFFCMVDLWGMLFFLFVSRVVFVPFVFLNNEFNILFLSLDCLYSKWQHSIQKQSLNSPSFHMFLEFY